ncbi:MAG: 50S ribosomal protein L9 [Thermoanaerobaculia bacterium]
MKVILMSDLRHRGRRGQVVEVKPGFARNFLLPQGLALLASPGNIKRFEHEKKKIDARHDEALGIAAAEGARISAVKLELRKRAQETGALYGSVSVSDIVAALAEKGIEVDRRQIDLAGGIKTVGEHKVRVDLHADVVAELSVTVVAED